MKDKALKERLRPPAALLLTSLPPQAEFEREIIRERTKAGLEAAKARGRSGGRSGGISLSGPLTPIT